MSVKAVSWVLDDLQELDPTPTLVMLALADFADERHSCYPGQERIAARARCSTRTVVRHIQELERAGLLTVERRSRSLGRGEIRRTSNRYVLNVGARLVNGRVDSFVSDNLAPTNKHAGHNESDNLAHSTIESDKTGVSKVTTVSLNRNDPSDLDPPASPQPPGDSAFGSVAPGGAMGEGDFASFLGSLSAHQRAALVAALSGAGAPSAPRQETRDEVESPLSAERELLAGVLPQSMLAIPDTSVPDVVAAVGERLAAGWTKAAIRAAVASRPLPSQVRSMAGLVLARLRDCAPVDAPPPRSESGWSLTLPDGRVVDSRSFDWGKVTNAHNVERAASGDVPAQKRAWLETLPPARIETFLK